MNPQKDLRERLKSLPYVQNQLVFREGHRDFVCRDCIVPFIEIVEQKAIARERERVASKVWMLRQWLNEDRIDDPKKMVTNEQIIFMLSDLNKGENL